MVALKTQLYKEFTLESDKIAQYGPESLGGLARISDFSNMFGIKPLQSLYNEVTGVNANKAFSKEERTHYAQELYNVLITNQLKDQEFNNYYMRDEKREPLPKFNEGSKFIKYIQKKSEKTDPIKKCLASLVQNLLDDTKGKSDYREIFTNAVCDNFEQFISDMHRASDIVVKNIDKNYTTLISGRDLSSQTIDKRGNILFKSSPLVESETVNNIENLKKDSPLLIIPEVLKEYICIHAKLPIDTSEEDLHKLGKWPVVSSVGINTEGVKEYTIETTDKSLKLGKIAFVKPISEHDIAEYHEQHKLPIMGSGSDKINANYQLLKEDIAEYQSASPSEREKMPKKIQDFLGLSDQELKAKIQQDNIKACNPKQRKLTALIKCLREEHQLPHQDINSFIHIHHQGLVSGMQSGFLPERFRANKNTKIPDLQPNYKIGNITTLVCNKTGVKTMEHSDSIAYQTMGSPEQLGKIATINITVDFSNGGRPKTQKNYNVPPAVADLKANVSYTAHTSIAQMEIPNNLPLEKVKYSSTVKNILNSIRNLVHRVSNLFSPRDDTIEVATQASEAHTTNKGDVRLVEEQAQALVEDIARLNTDFDASQVPTPSVSKSGTDLNSRVKASHMPSNSVHKTMSKSNNMRSR